MLAKKINITNMISQNDFETIKSYSNLLSDAYNLCLDELRKNPDFKQIQQLILRKNMGYYDLATHSISTPCWMLMKYSSSDAWEKIYKIFRSWRYI